jgi:hypothetical protein
LELTPRRGKLDHIVLLEYVEEYPLILGLPGMNSRIETYIRRIEGDRTFHCVPMPQQLLGLYLFLPCPFSRSSVRPRFTCARPIPPSRVRIVAGELNAYIDAYRVEEGRLKPLSRNIEFPMLGDLDPKARETATCICNKMWVATSFTGCVCVRVRVCVFACLRVFVFACVFLCGQLCMPGIGFLTGTWPRCFNTKCLRQTSF